MLTHLAGQVEHARASSGAVTCGARQNAKRVEEGLVREGERNDPRLEEEEMVLK
jgi:hypothetical protein